MLICSCKYGFASICKHLRWFADICSSYLQVFVTMCNCLPLFIYLRSIRCYLLSVAFVYLPIFAIIAICSEQSFATICTHGLGGSKATQRGPGMGKGIGKTKRRIGCLAQMKPPGKKTCPPIDPCRVIAVTVARRVYSCPGVSILMDGLLDKVANLRRHAPKLLRRLDSARPVTTYKGTPWLVLVLLSLCPFQIPICLGAMGEAWLAPRIDRHAKAHA